MGNVGVIIFLVIFVGGWVIKLLNKMSEESQGKERKGSASGSTPSEQDYEALAEHRRQQLQAQARQRRDHPPTQASTQPPAQDLAAMSMAERIELARQRQSRPAPRAEVQQRAEAMLRAQQQAAQEQAEQARRAEIARRQAQQQQAQRQRAAPQQAQQAPRRRDKLSGIPQREEHLHQASRQRVLSGKRGRGAKPALAREADTGPRRRRRKPLLDLSRLNRRSLKQAVVLKEILDQPLALRNPQ